MVTRSMLEKNKPFLKALHFCKNSKQIHNLLLEAGIPGLRVLLSLICDTIKKKVTLNPSKKDEKKLQNHKDHLRSLVDQQSKLRRSQEKDRLISCFLPILSLIRLFVKPLFADKGLSSSSPPPPPSTSPNPSSPWSM